MRMKLLATVTALACLLLACSGDDDSDSSPTATAALTATSTPAVSVANVRGVALVGPMCPVIQVGTPCPDQPWQGDVVVRNRGGDEVARTTTDADGRFFLSLPPGVYVLIAATTTVIPAPVELNVSVIAGAVTDVELLLDSGIR